ncbi:hypothetical protein [Streptomyces sp. 8K308]|uniref:hypothetical protein n=1 Tax=Streptomyces sp. 8K308 TaxID=2530388 RepID=UPI00140529C5|nr:hypothetical protein [Streptomyces sp. 8K308]
MAFGYQRLDQPPGPGDPAGGALVGVCALGVPMHPGVLAYDKVFFPRSWEEGLCDGCRTAATSADPVRRVLAALPEKLLLACGRTAPPTVVATIRAELAHHTPGQLAERIERRWYGSWNSRPLTRESDNRQDGYGPDDVAVWLLAPHPCRARCDDGWDPANSDRRCPHCATTPASEWPEDDQGDGDDAGTGGPADRSLAEALAHRPILECEGNDGSCGRPRRPALHPLPRLPRVAPLCLWPPLRPAHRPGLPHLHRRRMTRGRRAGPGRAARGAHASVPFPHAQVT